MNTSQAPVNEAPVTTSPKQAASGPVRAHHRPRLDALPRPGRNVNRLFVAGLAVIAGVAAGVAAPPVRAADSVTYEIVSDQGNVPTANVEYNENSHRTALQQVPLPWRLSVSVPRAASPTEDGAEIRADWRPYRWRYKYVTVRIYHGDELLCESTLDVGDATCYGSTPHRNYPQTGGVT